MLKKKAISATIWSSADIFMRQGLQFGISIALARLLTPEQFGTIALLYLFVGLASVFIDSGFSAALIQCQDITQTDESTVFWFGLGMGTFFAIGMWLLAPWVADFFGQPILVPLTGVLALNLFIGALGAIHGTLFFKHLDFKTPMKIGAIATSISGAIGVIMALKGYGVWALALQTLASTVLTTALQWKYNSWRPTFTFSFVSARRLFGFGGYLFMAALLEAVYYRIYTVLIGKIYGVRDLAFYNRADGTKQMPVGLLDSILSRVTFPIFSVAAQDKGRLRHGARTAIRSMMLINIPMMLGMIVTAEPLVGTLFGEQWLPATPILQVLCLGGMLIPLHVINRNVLVAQGHANLFFRLEVFKKLLGTGLVIFSSSFGAMGIAWSQVILAVIAFFINAYYAHKYISYGAREQISDFLPSLVLSGFMGGTVYWVGKILSLSLVAEFLIQIVIGVVIVLAGCHLFKLIAYKELIDILLIIKNRKNNN